MPFDYKKEEKEYYSANAKPRILFIPQQRFIALEGKGETRSEGGAFEKAKEVLHAVAYTLRNAEKYGYEKGCLFDYVLPPLEALIEDKKNPSWLIVSRLPEAIGEEVLMWAKDYVKLKKGYDTDSLHIETLTDAMCVQIMHSGSLLRLGPSIKKMEDYISSNGYVTAYSASRCRHEIYLGEKKTIVRIPIGFAG